MESLFLSYDRRERDEAREEGRRGRDTQRQREGGREILMAEENYFLFFHPARERGWRKEGREGERESEGEKF